MTRSVFHIRLREFELQAERIMDASLQTRPVAIISSHRSDGTVVALSDEAKQEGLYAGLMVSLVRKMSHGTLLLPYNRSLYDRLHRYLYRTFCRFTPLVEPATFGQFYLDMTGMNRLYKTPKQAGSLLAREITGKTGLSNVVGISPNKLVSRISTAVVPESIYEISVGEEARFLSPLNAPVLPTVHEKVVNKIVRFLFLNRVAQIQRIVASPEEAYVLFGDFSLKLTREAQGKDTSAVRPPELRDHLMEQMVLPMDTNDKDLLRGAVRTLAEQVAFQLRKRRQTARKVRLEVHYTDGYRSVRTGQLLANDDHTVTDALLVLFTKANIRRNRIRSILADATNFQPAPRQLELFQQKEEENSILSIALDRIRKKYGYGMITPAITLQTVAQA